MRIYMGSCSTSKECHLGLRKGAWTKEEDALLRKCMEKNGDVKWSLVPKLAGLNRCRKSCRLRWLNYLCPNIKRSKFEDAEVDLIIRLHKLLGNRWSLIAGRIPGRTANDIKNYWNTHLSKQSLVNKVGKEANASYVKGLLVNKDGKEANARYVEVVKPKPQCIPCNWRWSKDTEASQDDHHQEESNAPIPASIPASSSDNNATCMYSIFSTENLDVSIPASSSTIINNASQDNHHQEESNIPIPASSSNDNATCMDSIFSTENLDVPVPNTEELENFGLENFGSIGDDELLLEGFKEWDDMYLDNNLWRDFEAI